MYKKFDDLLMDLSGQRPTQSDSQGKVFFFNDQPVRLIAGQMEDVHWMDIHIELKRFKVDNLGGAKKVLMANIEMGGFTPIPTWFGLNPNTDNLVFINRLDWRHITVKILDEHIMRCIAQMAEALNTEGV